MVGVEQQESLRFIKFLVSKKPVEIDLWENDRGDLFIRLPLSDDNGKVLIQTSSEKIIAFLNNELHIRQLLQSAVSPFVTQQGADGNHLMYLPDADFSLLHPDRSYFELQTI